MVSSLFSFNLIPADSAIYAEKVEKTVKSNGWSLWVKWAGKVRATTLFAMKKLVKLASKFEPWLSKRKSFFFFLLEVVEATIHKTLFSILGSPIQKC
jgi:hypothetical protein